LRVVAAVSLVDIGPLDRTAGERLGAVKDVPQGLGGSAQREGERLLQCAGWPSILRRMSRMIRPSRLRRITQLPLMPPELLPQPDAVPSRQAVEPLDGRMQELGIGRKGDGVRLHRGVDRDPLEALAA
jgi:hypothetical protein